MSVQINNKIIPVRAWQLIQLIDAIERLRPDTLATPQATGIDAGLMSALDMMNVYLGSEIAEAKIESNVQILNPVNLN